LEKILAINTLLRLKLLTLLLSRNSVVQYNPTTKIFCRKITVYFYLNSFMKKNIEVPAIGKNNNLSSSG